MTRLHTLGAIALLTGFTILAALSSSRNNVESHEDPTAVVVALAVSVAAEAETPPSAPPMAIAKPSQVVQAPEAKPELPYTESELEMIAKTVWGEARGCAPDEQRLVIWTIFQQVDADGDFSNYSTIAEIIAKPNNYAGYSESHPIDPDIYTLVCEEAEKWANGELPPTLEPYAPALPYLFFDGDGQHNWFRAEWR